MAPAWIDAFLAEQALPASYLATVEGVVLPLAERVAAEARGRPSSFVLGLCGPQASGKSTMTLALARALESQGLSCAWLSIDDLYLSRTARLALAADVHPLLAVRGPPGTHDVALGLQVLDGLAGSGPTALPRFDKAADDQRPASTWPIVRDPPQVTIFEGWCVGARPQADAELATPINRREAEEDPDGVWRSYVNEALAGAYQSLFARIDHLALLAPPDFEVVAGWRQEQERKLRARRQAAGQDPDRTMSDAEVARFVQLYERLTRHILREMPGRAETVIRLRSDRSPLAAR